MKRLLRAECLVLVIAIVSSGCESNAGKEGDPGEPITDGEGAESSPESTEGSEDGKVDVVNPDVGDSGLGVGDGFTSPSCATDLANQFSSREHSLVTNAQQDQTVPVVVTADPDGGFWVAWTDSPWSEEALHAHVQHVAVDLEFDGTRIDIPGSVVLGMHAHPGGKLALAHGRRTGPESTDANWGGSPGGVTPNTLFFSRFDGEEEEFRTKVQGGNGYGSSPESTWLLPDGTGASVSVAYNGARYALFYVIGRHFEDGQVHQADEYVELDSGGAVVETTRRDWINSHSFWPSAVASGDTFFTLTVADPFPEWGVRFGSREPDSESEYSIVWPSADIAADVSVSGPVGRAGALFKVGGRFATALRTWVDKASPASEKDTTRRLAFLSFESDGSLFAHTELSTSPGPENDRVVGGARFGDAVLTLVSEAANASVFGGAPVVLQALSAAGEPLGEPQTVDARYAWSSDPVTLTDGSVVWGAVRDNVSETLQLFHVKCVP